MSSHLPAASSTSFRRPDIIDEPLYVVTTVFNPQRYRSRWKLYKEFEKYILDSGAHLLTVEASFGQREEVIVEHVSDRLTIVNVRTKYELWLKENLTNIGIHHLPKGWKYVATVDADMMFTRRDWVGETLHQLQRYSIVQMYSQIIQMGPDHQPLNTSLSFMEGWRRGIPFTTKSGQVKDESYFKKGGYGDHHCKLGWAGSPGGAWAYTREALNLLGGLIDWAILGSGDYHMAMALMGFVEMSLNGGYHPEYVKSMMEWQERALKNIKRNVGHMKGTLLHSFHGKMKERGYEDRWKILVKHQYNPRNDIFKDVCGVLQLNEDKWQMRDDIRDYFSRRNEDSIDI